MNYLSINHAIHLKTNVFYLIHHLKETLKLIILSFTTSSSSMKVGHTEILAITEIGFISPNDQMMILVTLK